MNTEMTNDGGAAAAALPTPCAAPAATPQAAGGLTMQALTAAGNNLTRGLMAAGRQMLRLQAGMLRSVTAIGFIFGEAKRLAPQNFTKLFPQKQGDEIKPGMFACSYSTARNYVKTAEAVWQRAAAAGKAQELEAQVRAYIADARVFEAPQRDIPVLAELVDAEWVSMRQVMAELGVIKQGRHRALAHEEAAPPALPGPGEFAAQAWMNASGTLRAFRSLMETDIPRLNRQQRHALRDELRSMLAELDRLETAAPGLD